MANDGSIPFNCSMNFGTLDLRNWCLGNGKIPDAMDEPFVLFFNIVQTCLPTMAEEDLEQAGEPEPSGVAQVNQDGKIFPRQYRNYLFSNTKRYINVYCTFNGSLTFLGFEYFYPSSIDFFSHSIG